MGAGGGQFSQREGSASSKVAASSSALVQRALPVSASMSSSLLHAKLVSIRAVPVHAKQHVAFVKACTVPGAPQPECPACAIDMKLSGQDSPCHPAETMLTAP